MARNRFNIILSAAASVAILLTSCGDGQLFKPVAGFSPETNSRLKQFFKVTAKEPGRKVAG